MMDERLFMLTTELERVRCARQILGALIVEPGMSRAVHLSLSVLEARLDHLLKEHTDA